MGEVLAIDVGGSKVKMRVPSDPERRAFESGKKMTAQQMVDGVKGLIGGWNVDRITIGIPAPVRSHRPVREPVNLGRGWVEFDYEAAFGMPVKMINDAAMQAVGDYESGILLFLGLGTGLGSAIVANHVVVPMELAHLPFKNGRTFEEYVGGPALEKGGKRKWRRNVRETCELLDRTFNPDVTVVGGGNAPLLKDLPPKCKLGLNANAFLGGFRLWEPVWANA